MKFEARNGTSASSVTGNVTHTYGTAGNYSVVVTATGAKATDTATVTVPLVVNDPPPPLVTITSVVPATPETGQTTQLMAAPSIGSGPITSWSWTFGDGTPPSNLQNPTHAWITPGTYTVTVTATGPTGATGGDQKLVTVVLPPVPVIGSATATPNSVFTGDPVSFTATVGGTSGPITSWFWNFGDGVGTSTLQNPGYTYTSAGTYTATVTAAGPGGTSAPVTVLVQVSDPPPVITVPSASPSGPAIGQAVAFSVGPALGSGPITSWSWTFGDGIGTSTLQTPSYTYTSAGIYTATVTATGPGGIDTDTVVVQVGQPVLNVPTYLPVPAFTGEPVTFSVTAVGGASRPITSWSWTFGDGGTATVQNPSHTYAGAGSYTATVTATGPGGTSTPVSVLVVVGDPVTAGFTWSPLGGLAVQFTDTSTGAPPVTWAWTFGDGATSSAANPSHTYGSTGPFTVRLTVTDAFGHTDFTEQVVTPLP
ncbi:MAG: PKD domain-containing protein [Acidimicrobiales bacterium]